MVSQAKAVHNCKLKQPPGIIPVMLLDSSTSAMSEERTLALYQNRHFVIEPRYYRIFPNTAAGKTAGFTLKITADHYI